MQAGFGDEAGERGRDAVAVLEDGADVQDVQGPVDEEFDDEDEEPDEKYGVHSFALDWDSMMISPAWAGAGTMWSARLRF